MTTTQSRNADDVPVMPAVDASLLQQYTSHRLSHTCDLLLDANEGAASQAMDVRIDGERLSGDVLSRYPSAAGLEACIAEHLGVEAKQVLVTAGGDDALQRCCMLMLDASRNAVLTTPTFEMLRRYAMLQRADVREVQWMDGAFPVQKLIDCMDKRTGIVAVVSPNNPTGGVAREQDVRRIAAAAANAGSLVVVDLAYTEFADVDLTSVAINLPNAVVVRTLSKAWGLAGLRIGYAVAGEPVINWLRAMGHPYAVAGVSLALAERALYAGMRTSFINQVRMERAALQDELCSLGVDVLPSQGNFVLGMFADAHAVRAALAADGIAVRGFPDLPMLSNSLRITLPGNARAFERLVGTIRRICGKTAMTVRSQP